ncbi:hypothetical protein EJ03DRAFT_186276 [Teratosphaeria nubilosa]|uniref:Uncharacterized protein n=1 Tax=Teratosphaeria nubilosa TaxID=161662 RepID=A0A6G1LI00_9PEZI|nr:hypothetical protein EJ03DRAFT_186276 [Teratosphaeria nubilosa]
MILTLSMPCCCSARAGHPVRRAFLNGSHITLTSRAIVSWRLHGRREACLFISRPSRHPERSKSRRDGELRSTNSVMIRLPIKSRGQARHHHTSSAPPGYPFLQRLAHRPAILPLWLFSAAPSSPKVDSYHFQRGAWARAVTAATCTATSGTSIVQRRGRSTTVNSGTTSSSPQCPARTRPAHTDSSPKTGEDRLRYRRAFPCTFLGRESPATRGRGLITTPSAPRSLLVGSVSAKLTAIASSARAFRHCIRPAYTVRRARAATAAAV